MYARHIVFSTSRRVVHHATVGIGSSVAWSRTPSLGQSTGLGREGRGHDGGGEHGKHGVERSGRVFDEVCRIARKCGLQQQVNRHLSRINPKARRRRRRARSKYADRTHESQIGRMQGQPRNFSKETIQIAS